MTSKTKVWLDDTPEVKWRSDLHPAPEWIHVRWPNEMIALLTKGDVSHISPDRDLFDEAEAAREGRRERTGYDVVVWIEEQTKLNGFIPPAIRVHSQNGPGRDRILAAIRQIETFDRENRET